jgi:DNA-binding NarL/FixJ family response regulator
VVGEAGSVCEAVEMIQSLEPHLALVDADLPDMDEAHDIRRLCLLRPQTQVVLTSTHESEDLLLAAVRGGVRGFLLKNHSLSKFMAAIRALERGEAVVPRAMVGRLLKELSQLHTTEDPETLNILTPREMDVLVELGRGSSNRQIASRLNIAENTVKVHVHNILEKLDLRNRRQAARLARARGLDRLTYAQTLQTAAGDALALRSPSPMEL